MRNLTFTAVLLLILTTTLIAQQPAAQSPTAQQPAASPAQVKAAEQLIEMMEMEKTFNQSMEAMLQAQMNANPMLKQFEDIMRAFMGKYLKWSELKADYVKLYTDVFTESELKEMTQFYQTPLGKKMLNTLPALLTRGGQITSERLQPHLPELQKTIMERMQQKQAPKEQPAQSQPQQQPKEQPKP